MSTALKTPLAVASRSQPRDELFHLGGTHIAAGMYEAAGGKLHFEKKWGNWKAVVRWTVLVPDPDHADGHRRVPIKQFFNLDRKQRPKPCGDLARALMRILGTRRLDRARLPRAFFGVYAKVEVVDVVRDQHWQPLDEATYSRVKRIVEVIAGRGHAFSLDQHRTKLGLRKLRCAALPPLSSSPSGTATSSPSGTGTSTNAPVPEQEGNV